MLDLDLTLKGHDLLTYLSNGVKVINLGAIGTKLVLYLHGYNWSAIRTLWIKIHVSLMMNNNRVIESTFETRITGSRLNLWVKNNAFSLFNYKFH